MLDGFESAVFGRLGEQFGFAETNKNELRAIADAIRDSLFTQQRALIEDPYRTKAALCPRRAGKSFVAASYAFDVCLRKPNARVMIISLSHKVGKKLYWTGGDAVIPLLVSQFGVPVKPFQNELRLQFSNGSNLWLVGADKRDSIEDLRGDQYDLVIVDEAKSYPKFLLDELLDQVIEPALRDRLGTMLLIGTPGSDFSGAFFEATYPGHASEKRVKNKRVQKPTSRNYLEPEPFWLENPAAKPEWSRHSWTVLDNVAKPHLWQEALDKKELKGWADDEPIWLRESLGQWVRGSNEFVYEYANLAGTDPERVHWRPDFVNGNEHGLPKDTEWRYLLGVDTGFVDAFAMVVGAYNPHDGILYHVWDWHSSHLDPIAQAERIEKAIAKFGKFHAIVVDPGAGGAPLIDMLNRRMGIAARTAEKSERRAYQEFLNADFRAGKVKIRNSTPRSDLATQLATLQFDMSSGMSTEELARREKLTENKSQANDLCDAFLYMWRWSYHYYTRDRAVTHEYGSAAWYRARETAAMAAMVKQRDSQNMKSDWSGWVSGNDPLAPFRNRGFN